MGRFALALAITAPVFMLLNLQLRTVLVTDKSDKKFQHYLGLRMLTIIVSLLFIIGIIFFGGYRGMSAIVILIVGISKGIESVSDIIFSIFQRDDRMDKLSISLIIKGTSSLFFFGIIMFSTHNLLLSLIGLNLSWLLVLLIFDIKQAKIFRSIKPIFNLQAILKLIKISYPLGIVMMLISLNINVPRYFLEKHVGEMELGIYAAISYFMVIGNVIIFSLGQASTTRLTKYYLANDFSGYVRSMLNLIYIALCLGVVGILISWVFGKQILSIVYNQEYSSFSKLFVLMMVASLISYISSSIGYAITAARYFKIQIPISLTVLLINLVASFILIPKLGMQGAAWAIIYSMISQMLISLVIVIIIISSLKKRAQL